MIWVFVVVFLRRLLSANQRAVHRPHSVSGYAQQARRLCTVESSAPPTSFFPLANIACKAGNQNHVRHSLLCRIIMWQPHYFFPMHNQKCLTYCVQHCVKSCVCVCVCVHLHACMCMHMHACTHAYMCACMHV